MVRAGNCCCGRECGRACTGLLAVRAGGLLALCGGGLDGATQAARERHVMPATLLRKKEMEMVKDKEGERILAKVTDQSYVFALAINGKQYDSVDFSKKIEQLGITGKSDIIFIIGGSLGLSKAILQRANEEISFGKLTFPHQLMR